MMMSAPALPPVPPDELQNDFEDLRLDRQLCFALYSALNKFTRLYNTALEPLKLTFPQYLALLVLWEGSPRTVNEIAQALGSSFGTISPRLQRLEESGLVLRQRDTQDERRVLVHITDKGLDLRKEVLAARRGIVDHLCIGEDEAESLREDLRHLIATLG